MAINGCHNLLPLLQNYFATRMPLLAGLEFNVEQDAPVGVSDRNAHTWNPIGHGAVEIFVIVGGTKSSLLHIPHGEQSPTIDKTFRFHFEEIGKIRAQRQSEGDTDLFTCVVHNVEVFVDTILNRTFE